MLRPQREQCPLVQQSSCWPQRHVVVSAHRLSRDGRGAVLCFVVVVVTTVLPLPG